MDSCTVYRIDGDATESDVGLGRFQQAVDRRDLECRLAGDEPLAERSGQMDLLQHFGQLRCMVVSVYIFV